MKKCPICKGKLVDIVYGLPMGNDFKEEEKQNIFFGGCVRIKGHEPLYHCYNCKKSFFKNLKDYIDTDDRNRVDY